MAQLVNNPPAMWETWVRPLGWEDPLEKGTATHSSILAWKFHGLYNPWGHKESIFILILIKKDLLCAWHSTYITSYNLYNKSLKSVLWLLFYRWDNRGWKRVMYPKSHNSLGQILVQIQFYLEFKKQTCLYSLFALLCGFSLKPKLPLANLRTEL